MKYFLVPFLFVITQLTGQESGIITPRLDKQIRFSLMPGLYSNLELVNVGPPLLKSSLDIGGEATITYAQQVWKGFGITGGIGFGLVPYNFSYDFEVPPGSVLDDPDDPTENLSSLPTNTTINHVITFPLTLEKLIQLDEAERLFLHLEAGIKWNIKGNYPFIRTGRASVAMDHFNRVTYFEYRISSADTKGFISYLFKAGLFKYNNRNNSFNWNLVVQYSPSRMLTGTYQFNELGFESYGTMEHHDTFIGLEVIYGLTMCKWYK